ncbi:ACP S-malonyltransferase [Paenibacillus sp. ACRRX]|uniref:ACP S-malonyltransferase n=1 Tax=Paenibacillus sp. ACRRX TaxID=2918206 RepID=UPI001EF5F437|nr:ACP S-malonyltransferase [Paenibacillus sp. ACRRX]MCG7409132.1 ACP S-malonyltransferase [Paenibacillus sp. ACRRX]
MSKSIVFMYAGQGSQYYGMGRALFEQEPVFRDWMLRLDQAAAAMIGESLLDKLYDPKQKQSEPFDRTLFTHPAIYMIETAMTQLMFSYGIYPDYVLGESMGEFAAATAAGMMGWQDGLEMVIEQAKTLDNYCAAGGMLAILDNVSIYTDNGLLHEHSELAAQLSDTHFVITGNQAAIQAVQTYLHQQYIVRELLPVSHAFHSRFIDHAAAPYKHYLSQKKFMPGNLTLVSGVDGRPLQELQTDYLWQVIRQPISLQKSFETLEHEGPAVFIDLGPSGGMANMAKRCLATQSESEMKTIMSRFRQDAANWDSLKQMQKHTRTRITSNHKSADKGEYASPHKSDNKKISKPDYTSNHKSNHKEAKSMRAYVFPGQGSQQRGMGEGLFDEYSEMTALADRILGYSIKELCVQDPNNLLGQTQYTQPALYVVNALHYLKALNEFGLPNIVAGHSLGEYNALYAAGAFDFETGLRLVQRRGVLMSQASGGGMAAVIGLDEDKLRQALEDHGLDQIDIANYNNLTQIVISGPQADMLQAQQACEAAGARLVIPLKVSGAFHSRMMTAAYDSFGVFLSEFSFGTLTIPVVSNVTARPYEQHQLKQHLASQITHSVRWTDTIRYLMGLGVEEYREIGPGNVLTKLIASIRKEATPLLVPNDIPAEEVRQLDQPDESRWVQDTIGMTLGDPQFKRDYGLQYAYMVGAMYKGIASEQMVVRAGQAGMLGVFGAGGLSLDRVEAAIRTIQQQLSSGESYGINLLHDPEHPEKEEQLVDLYVQYGVKLVEASAYMSVNAALVRYRACGLSRHSDGSVQIRNCIIAKVSRPEVATSFLSPAPERIISKLLLAGSITPESAALLREVPMADDISVEADSGGHTDHRSPYTLLPAMIRLRDDYMKRFGYNKRIRIGAAGGIGTPEAALAAYMMGADYLVTGSINQCTVEANTSESVKELLQQADIQDMDYAPAGDMFELGAKVQVLKKGGFFSARANKLYELYRNFDSIEQIDERTRQMIEEKFFQKTFDEVYAAVRAYKSKAETEKAERDSKHKMALIFKWYFAMSNLAAINGDPAQRVNYQIHCGPALGAFNQWVKGTNLEHWQQRHVDEIGRKLCDETAELLRRQVLQYAT